MRWYVPVGLAVLIVIVSSFFLFGSLQTTPSVAPTENEVRVAELGPQYVEAVGARITVTKSYITPEALTIPAGKGLALIIQSTEARTLTAPALGETITVPANEPVRFKTGVLSRGTITFYCSSGCDAGVSMTVTVE